MRSIDLFCGMGGMGLGLEQAGIKCIGAFDSDPVPLAVRTKNGMHGSHVLDLSDVEQALLNLRPWECSLVAGSPPCQDFSSAGNMKEGVNASLTVAFAKIAVGCGARFALMENVPLVLKSKAWRQAAAIFKEARWSIVYHVVNAGWCGIPQNRVRAMVLACQGPPAWDWLRGMKALQGNKVPSVRDALPWIEVESYYRKGTGNQERSGRRAFSVDEPSLTVMGKNDPVSDLERRRLADGYYFRNPGGYSKRSVFSVNEPSPTVMGNNGLLNKKQSKGHPNNPVPPDGLRRLTPEERACIQGFPYGWRLQWPGGPGPETEGAKPGPAKRWVEQMIGNACPPPLAETAGKLILSECR